MIFEMAEADENATVAKSDSVVAAEDAGKVAIVSAEGEL